MTSCACEGAGGENSNVNGLTMGMENPMGIFTPDLNTLRELYRTELERAFNMEKQIAEKGLPAMIKNATNPELAAAFEEHLDETQQHVARLERILNGLEGEANETKCKVVSTLISSADSDVSDAKDPMLRDVVLIAAGNQVEHHEIAVYGTLRTWAEVLGETEEAEILDRTLNEEKAADAKLSALAAQINVAAPVA
jgi:ferritin-like metal-binding protein YciE